MLVIEYHSRAAEIGGFVHYEILVLHQLFKHEALKDLDDKTKLVRFSSTRSSGAHLCTDEFPRVNVFPYLESYRMDIKSELGSG